MTKITLLLLVIATLFCSSTSFGEEQTFNYVQESSNKQVECLAKNIYYESRGQSEVGQYGVAFVTMNRTASGKFPDSVCKVVQQKTGQTCQFSWVCLLKNSPKIIRDKMSYQKIKQIASDVYHNYHMIRDTDPTKGALFFAEKNAARQFKKHMAVTAIIGDHVFYNRKSRRNKI